MFEHVACSHLNSRDIAAFIAQTCRDQQLGYTNTKIQKLLYCVYGTILAKFDVRICSEQPRAWPNGPVFPRVFHFIYRGMSMDEYSDRVRCLCSQEEQDFIAMVVRFFGGHTANQLACWSRVAGSPWDLARSRPGATWDSPLCDQDIAHYFRKCVLA